MPMPIPTANRKPDPRAATGAPGAHARICAAAVAIAAPPPRYRLAHRRAIAGPPPGHRRAIAAQSPQLD